MPVLAERYVVKRCEAIGNVANLISASVILVSVSVLKHLNIPHILAYYPAQFCHPITLRSVDIVIRLTAAVAGIELSLLINGIFYIVNIINCV